MVASWEVREGPVLSVLAGMADRSVSVAITSPPYYGLRAYDGDQVVDWPAVEFYPMPGLQSYMAPITIPAGPAALGGESDPLAYIGHLVAVFREVRRVLRDDGLLWLNLGETFYGGKGANGNSKARRTAAERGYKQNAGTVLCDTRPVDLPLPGYKPKDRIAIPEMAALALQADGWYWRAVMPWVKRNGLPSSVDDRPGSAVEWVHLLAKGRRPFYDVHAVELPAAEYSAFKKAGDKIFTDTYHGDTRPAGLHPTGADNGTRRRRNSDWWFDSLRRADAAGPVGGVPGPDGEIIAFDCTVASFPGAHFATWPPALVEPMILASTSARGCCPVCGAGWVRVVEKTGDRVDRWAPGATAIDAVYHDQVGSSSVLRTGTVSTYETTDWRPSCSCSADADPVPGAVGAPVPAVVLDPFSGSGTTGAVALSLGRRYIGIELSSEYAAMSRERIGGAQPALFGL